VVSHQPGKQAANTPRRQPRFAAFLITGALLGILIGVALSVIGPEDPRYDGSAALGFLGLIFAGLGALLGGLIAVLLEKRR
jgi:ethanolamine transporter EutH